VGEVPVRSLLRGVGAVTRAPIGVIRTLPETRRLLEQCVREIFEVARARQIALSDGIVEKTMMFLDLLRPADNVASKDIADGKPSNSTLEWAVVRLGQEAGITPLYIPSSTIVCYL